MDITAPFFTSLRMVASVRNLRFECVLLLLIFAGGCGTSQSVTSQTDTVKTGKPADKAPDEVIISNEKEETPDLPAKAHFNIGIILPLYLDSVIAIPDTAEMYYPQQSKLGAEFYFGAKMALDSLAKKGLKAQVHVYDDMNDRERIRQFAHTEEFKNMDLLLGPVYNNNLRLMADYARKDSIYMVSPLSPATGITSGNPYYIMVNPSIEVHCKRLFNHAVHHHYYDNVILISNPNNPVESEYARYFKDYLTKYHAETGSSTFQIKEIPYTPGEEAKPPVDIYIEMMPQFETGKKNVVIVPSVDKAYIYSVARRLYPLADPPKELKDAESYDITVLGLPVWGDQEGLRFDYTARLKVHFTSSYFIAPDFFSNENLFYRKYTALHGNEPSEYAIKGFDLMLYFGNLLLAHGVDFGNAVCVGKTAGLHTNFSFNVRYAGNAPTENDDYKPAVDFIENKYVHLLRYDGYTLKKIE